MGTEDNYTTARKLFEKEIQDMGLHSPRPECISARSDKKEDVKNYKRAIKLHRRNYDVYEATVIVNGEHWMMACCYGNFRDSAINQFLCILYYHIAWISEEKRAFLNALKESRFFLTVLVFAFIPYLTNYFYLIYGMVELDLLVFDNYSEIGFFISIVSGLFYWPLGIITGYGCLYALLF